MVASSFRHIEGGGGGGAKSCTLSRRGGGAKSFGITIFPFCSPALPIINDQSQSICESMKSILKRKSMTGSIYGEKAKLTSKPN